MVGRYERDAIASCQSDFAWLEEARFWRNFAWLRPYAVSTRAVLPPAKRPHMSRAARQELNEQLAAGARAAKVKKALETPFEPDAVAKTQPMAPVARVPQQRKPPRAERVPPPRIPHSQRNLTPGWPKETTP